MRLNLPADGEDIDLRTIDLHDPGLYADGYPHAIWRVMRAQAPVFWHPLGDGGFWCVTRYDDVRRVLRDHESFSSQGGNLLSNLGRPDPAAGCMVTSTDPPRHTTLREPLARLLAPAEIRRREGALRAAVRRFVQPLLSGDVWDVAVAATELPMVFTGTLMGVPDADWPQLARWTMMAVASEDPHFQEGDSRLTESSAHFELLGYFSDEVDKRGSRRSEDLIGTLMATEIDGRRLTHEEIVYNCFSMTLGANGTTPHVVTAMVLALAEHHDAHRLLSTDPDMVRSAVDEGIRWASPANHFLRHAVTDLTLSGTAIRAGDPVVAWIGSANRDETVFSDPYTFDVTRTPNRHIAFGVGPHYCVGAPLARTSLGMLFDELVTLFERFDIAGPVEHLRSNVVAGIRRLPVQALPRSARPALSRS